MGKVPPLICSLCPPPAGRGAPADRTKYGDIQLAAGSAHTGRTRDSISAHKDTQPSHLLSSVVDPNISIFNPDPGFGPNVDPGLCYQFRKNSFRVQKILKIFF